MPLEVPPLETARLIVRPFVMDDLPTIHAILSVAFESRVTLDERREWLRWTMLAYDELAKLAQPPYGDRAIVLRQTSELIGSCGYVPLLDVFGQLPSFRTGDALATNLTTTEFGMFWAIAPQHQRRGYATEAARAMLDHAFNVLRLRRISAKTEYENLASQSVMRKLGMRLERNPLPEPPWLQVVGVLDNPRRGSVI